MKAMFQTANQDNYGWWMIIEDYLSLLMIIADTDDKNQSWSMNDDKNQIKLPEGTPPAPPETLDHQSHLPQLPQSGALW